MRNAAAENLSAIEKKESHLWLLTLSLLILYAGILIATYFVIVSESRARADSLESMAYKALGGLSILTILFSGYVLHSRVTFKRVKKIFEIHAMRDSLTGLYNRYYFEERIKEEIQRVDRNRETLAILLCDVDNFKAIND